MQTILEARDTTWQNVEGTGEVLNSSSWILGAISGLAVLPEIGGGEQERTGSEDTANAKAGRTNRLEHVLPAGRTNRRSIVRVPRAQKIGVSGGRAVLATRAVDGVPGSTTGLGVLEHGFGLDATAEGSIGLPEGSTLFAQNIVLGGTDRYHHVTRHGRSVTGGTVNGGTVNGGNGSHTGRWCGGEGTSRGSTTLEGHVLLLSDRVRSKTNILVVSSDGEVEPAVTGTSKVHSIVDISTRSCCLSSSLM